MTDLKKAQSWAGVTNSVHRIHGSVESYAHRAAKDVFAGWLRDVAREACLGDTSRGNPWVAFGDLEWRVNRDGPHFGVWTEYPIGRSRQGNQPSGDGWHGRDGLDPVWDEDCGAYAAEDNIWAERPPSFDELVSLGRTPEFIADIAVQHKGSITHVIEVVHKNQPNDKKIDAFFNMGVRLLTIPTRWVLGQVARPDHIPGEFWMWGPK